MKKKSSAQGSLLGEGNRKKAAMKERVDNDRRSAIESDEGMEGG